MKIGMTEHQVSKAQLMPTLNMKRLAHLSFIKENYIWSHVMVGREDSSLRQMQRQIFSNFYTKIPKRLNYSSVMEEYLSIACMYQGSFFQQCNEQWNQNQCTHSDEIDPLVSLFPCKKGYPAPLFRAQVSSREWINAQEHLYRSLPLPCAFSLHAQNLCQLR